MEGLSEIVSSFGVNLPDLVQHIGKIQGMIPKIKEFIPKINEWEKSLSLKENQKVLYCLMPTADEIFIYVNVIEDKEYELKDGSIIPVTEIVDIKFKFRGFEELERILSYVPNM